jgi:hypothetical protein
VIVFQDGLGVVGKTKTKQQKIRISISCNRSLLMSFPIIHIVEDKD